MNARENHRKTKGKRNFVSINNKKALATSLYSVIFCLFFPMSKGAVLMMPVQTVIYYSLGVMPLLITYVLGNRLDRKSAFIGVYILIYLAIATLYSSSVFNADFSIARFAPIAIAVFFLSLDFSLVPERKAMVITFEFLTIVVLFANALIIAQNEYILQFLVNNYTQFNSDTVLYTLSKYKPVFTFGVHSYAAFFYMLMFFLWYATQMNKQMKRKRYYIYMLSIFLCNVLLVSSTAFGFSILMIILFSRLLKNFISKAILAIACIIGWTYATGSVLGAKYLFMLTSQTNGVLGRYGLQSTLFNRNFEALNRSWLGIGYTIPDSVYFADSGFIVLFTIGNLILPVGLYLLLWFSMRRNIPQYSKTLFFILMLFEFALSSLTYLKTILFLLFVINYLKALDGKSCSNSLVMNGEDYYA